MTQGYPVSQRSVSPIQQQDSHTTPDVDNYGHAAVGGGVAGIAYDVADQRQRESGAQALRDIDNLYRSGPSPPNDPYHGDDADFAPSHGGRMPIPSHGSSSSVLPLAAAGYAPGQMTPHSNYSGPTLHPDDMQGPGTYGMPPYQQRQSWYDSPYEATSYARAAPAGYNDIDPNAIADDDDDGLNYGAQHPKRKSMLGFGRDTHSRAGVHGAAAGTAAGAGAGALASGTSMHQASANGIFGNAGSRDASGNYTPVPGGVPPGTPGAANGSAAHLYNAGASKEGPSDYLASENKHRKKRKCIIGAVIVVVVVLAIVGGVVGGILGSRKSGGGSSGSSSGGESAAEDDGKGDLSKDSSEIQALMNNKNLHRVFPGIDYTPINTQYPDCLTNPPSQNNVTRDMAVLSQLTNTLRLYGTDCNQTEMALHAIDRLGLTDMKLWLGVWLGNNDTTNNRQISDMWTILDKHGADPFVGVAVGNEVLFRKDLTATELSDVLSSVKQNLTSKNIDLPVATSDLGSNWNTQLASEVDVVMANVHPFFAGVPVDQAAGWTWTFWQQNDVAVSGTKKNIISEVGWPSGGGNDCGTSVPVCPDKTSGSLAGIDEMNQFMNDWVCQSLANGTNYFW